jgi:hypothetical protein
MVSTYRSVARSFGSWLFAGGVVFAGASSCSGTNDDRIDTERAFVETPSGRRIATMPRAAARPADLRLPEEPYVVAKFEGAIPIEARAALAAAGFREVGYLPYDALLLEKPKTLPKAAERALSAAAIPGMAAWVSYRAEDRLSRELLPESIAARPKNDPVPVMIHVMPGKDRARARRRSAVKWRAKGNPRRSAVSPSSSRRIKSPPQPLRSRRRRMSSSSNACITSVF